MIFRRSCDARETLDVNMLAELTPYQFHCLAVKLDDLGSGIRQVSADLAQAVIVEKGGKQRVGRTAKQMRERQERLKREAAKKNQ